MSAGSCFTSSLEDDAKLFDAASTHALWTPDPGSCSRRLRTRANAARLFIGNKGSPPLPATSMKIKAS
ncbi:MAG: hypothetical protein ACLR0U_29255 [Enterocloster clostridioformis]